MSKLIELSDKPSLRTQVCYSHLSNKRDVHTFFEKFHPPKKNPPSTFIDFITKVSDIVAEPNEDFSDGHFEL